MNKRINLKCCRHWPAIKPYLSGILSCDIRLRYADDDDDDNDIEMFDQKTYKHAALATRRKKTVTAPTEISKE